MQWDDSRDRIISISRRLWASHKNTTSRSRPVTSQILKLEEIKDRYGISYLWSVHDKCGDSHSNCKWLENKETSLLYKIMKINIAESSSGDVHIHDTWRWVQWDYSSDNIQYVFYKNINIPFKNKSNVVSVSSEIVKLEKNQNRYGISDIWKVEATVIKITSKNKGYYYNTKHIFFFYNIFH